MKRSRNRKSPYAIIALRVILLVLFIAPIVVYIHTFGTAISDKHEVWGNMGSAMSGIYSPMLAILGAVLLARQVVSQQHMDKHHRDQAFLQASRDDLHYYLDQLRRLLDTSENLGGNLQGSLAHLDRVSRHQNDNGIMTASAYRKLCDDHPQLAAVWAAIYGILAGLGTPDEAPYRTAHTLAKQKIVVMISYATCVHLDQMYQVFCQGGGHLPYEFSDLCDSASQNNPAGSA